MPRVAAPGSFAHVRAQASEIERWLAYACGAGCPERVAQASDELTQGGRAAIADRSGSEPGSFARVRAQASEIERGPVYVPRESGASEPGANSRQARSHRGQEW